MLNSLCHIYIVSNKSINFFFFCIRNSNEVNIWETQLEPVPMALIMSLLGLEMSVMKTFSEFSISINSTSYSFTIINDHIVCTEKISRYSKVVLCLHASRKYKYILVHKFHWASSRADN